MNRDQNFRSPEFEKSKKVAFSEKHPGFFSKLFKKVSLLFQVFWRPTEVYALTLFAFKIWWNKGIPKLSDESNELRWCWKILPKVSRTFAEVIKQLDIKVRDSVCIFYLILRGLDTIEDDMSIDIHEKEKLLKNHHTILTNLKWKYSCGQGDEKELIENFFKVNHAFVKLPPKHQEIIKDITRKMGEGMAKFLNHSPENFSEWDQYCHYVAGLVGIGLTKLFKVENFCQHEEPNLSNIMGLFLQKTNITRDFLEDLCEDRVFWPTSAWKKFSIKKLEDFLQPQNKEKALNCLNTLINNALQHSLNCLAYLENVKLNKSIFTFCAIPQIHAISTLALCYDNYSVFQSSQVKIRKGLMAKMIFDINMFGVSACYYWFDYYANQIANIASANQKNSKFETLANSTLSTCQEISFHCNQKMKSDIFNLKWLKNYIFPATLFSTALALLFTKN